MLVMKSGMLAAIPVGYVLTALTLATYSDNSCTEIHLLVFHLAVTILFISRQRYYILYSNVLSMSYFKR